MADGAFSNTETKKTYEPGTKTWRTMLNAAYASIGVAVPGGGAIVGFDKFGQIVIEALKWIR